jgi:hypothetical protein
VNDCTEIAETAPASAATAAVIRSASSLRVSLEASAPLRSAVIEAAICESIFVDEYVVEPEAAESLIVAFADTEEATSLIAHTRFVFSVVESVVSVPILVTSSFTADTILVLLVVVRETSEPIDVRIDLTSAPTAVMNAENLCWRVIGRKVKNYIVFAAQYSRARS